MMVPSSLARNTIPNHYPVKIGMLNNILSEIAVAGGADQIRTESATI